MIYKYPKTIRTLIESQQIAVAEKLFCSEQVYEKILGDRKYVLFFIIYSIRACLVFDLNDNLIDNYHGCAPREKLYKGKGYYSWINKV